MNTHNIKLPPFPDRKVEEADAFLPEEKVMLVDDVHKYLSDSIEPYQKRIAELEHQLEQIGAGGVDGRYLMGGRNNFELPPLPYGRICNARDFIGDIQVMTVDAAQVYAREAIEADRKRAIKAIDARFRAALTAACPSDYSYQYYVGKADAYDIAWQIIKGTLNE